MERVILSERLECVWGKRLLTRSCFCHTLTVDHSRLWNYFLRDRKLPGAGNASDWPTESITKPHACGRCVIFSGSGRRREITERDACTAVPPEGPRPPRCSEEGDTLVISGVNEILHNLRSVCYGHPPPFLCVLPKSLAGWLRVTREGTSLLHASELSHICPVGA